VPPTAPQPVPNPPKAPEPTPAEKRALREQARREFRAAERARLEAEAKAKAGPAPGEAKAPAAAADAGPARTDADRVADTAHFLRGVFMPVLSVLALPFGYRLRLADFTAEKATDDAAAWLPIVRRYRWLDLVVTWAALPSRIVARVRELAERRPPLEAKP